MKAPSRSGNATRIQLRSALSGQCVVFLYFDGIKEFERATMTRIGRYQI
jgi:hypothetical protein